MTFKCIRAPAQPSDKIEEIHIFDLDRTLVRSNSSYLMACYLAKLGALSKRDLLLSSFHYLLYQMRLSSLNQQMQRVFDRFFQGKTRASVEIHLENFWNDCLQQELRQSLHDQLNLARARGQLCAIFSAGPDFLVEFVARKLQVHFVLSTHYRSDRSGLLFHSLGQVGDGANKAQAVQRIRYRFKQAKIFGYSDSRDDIAFLQSVDTAYLVDPDRALKRWGRSQSHAHHWK